MNGKVVLGVFLLLAATRLPAAEPTAREALKPFNDLVGSWRGTGEPEGTKAERIAGFWTEKIGAEWQFKDKDTWIKFAFEKGKHFDSGELRYVPDKKNFQLTVRTPDKQIKTFTGTLTGKHLTVERTDDMTKESQRLVFTFLHSNRFLYRYEIKKPDSSTFAKVFSVGATKEGVPFAVSGDGSPECIVSEGKGTIAVTYKGKTYYVCCSGCRDEFYDKPEKYIAEYEAKLKAKEKK